MRVLNAMGVIGAYCSGFAKGFKEGLTERPKSQSEVMAEAIYSVVAAFEEALIPVCVMRGVNVDDAIHSKEHYYAVVYGIADAIGQLANLGVEETKSGLKMYLSSYPNRDRLFKEISNISTNGKYFFLIMAAGQAVNSANKTKDRVGPMVELANKYLDSLD